LSSSVSWQRWDDSLVCFCRASQRVGHPMKLG
jgi:hypothetical protein